MIAIDPATDILGVVDVQPTFMPGGELPVPEGDAVVPAVNRLLAGPFRHAFATQDWHPPGHSSFASAHPGKAPYDTVTLAYGLQTLWPDHALQSSANAALHPDLDTRRIDLIIRKGNDPAIDSYSAFMENDRITVTGLHGWLRARGVRRIFFTGLATDFCVAWSAEDAAALGYGVFVIADACRGIGLPDPRHGDGIAAARHRLTQRGVRWIGAEEIAG
ncbi:MAG: bifunctional nicotinamidase/pyrazinamidase [Proteobacteria bacterium]|nr:bifunctional nicotinamidase/pyrazinamidase [Pseudomonadota bacterium]